MGAGRTTRALGKDGIGLLKVWDHPEAADGLEAELAHMELLDDNLPALPVPPGGISGAQPSDAV